MHYVNSNLVGSSCGQMNWQRLILRFCGGGPSYEVHHVMIVLRDCLRTFCFVFACLGCVRASVCGLPAVARTKGHRTACPERTSWVGLVWIDVFRLTCDGRARVMLTVFLFFYSSYIIKIYKNRITFEFLDLPFGHDKYTYCFLLFA